MDKRQAGVPLSPQGEGYGVGPPFPARPRRLLATRLRAMLSSVVAVRLPATLNLWLLLARRLRLCHLRRPCLEGLRRLADARQHVAPVALKEGALVGTGAVE